MTRYIALLRGVNVGGKSLLKMADLATALTNAGFADVKTYIQSGNVLFSSSKTNKKSLATQLRKTIADTFDIDTAVALFTDKEWRALVKAAPTWWGKDTAWKHNLLILTEDISAKEVVNAIGTLKPDIEELAAGKGVVYQSVSFKDFGKSTTGKLASHPLYKSMTIRNFNTTQKLAALLD